MAVRKRTATKYTAAQARAMYAPKKTSRRKSYRRSSSSKFNILNMAIASFAYTIISGFITKQLGATLGKVANIAIPFIVFKLSEKFNFLPELKTVAIVKAGEALGNMAGTSLGLMGVYEQQTVTGAYAINGVENGDDYIPTESYNPQQQNILQNKILNYAQ